jgi:GT2 family glycosyltransferase
VSPHTEVCSILFRLSRRCNHASGNHSPYVYAHEATEITAKFGLDRPQGRKLEFFLWQDTNRIGGGRAFQHCWDQFPDRDVVLIHADMAPMPDDLANSWYDALLRYRTKLPCAGMLACNLYYPRARDEPLRVQCAGGTFSWGQIDYLRGVVQEDIDLTRDGVPAGMLRKVRAVDWVTFGGVLIRREVIRACGSLDDRYRWAYCIDVDYCFEARLRGFQLFQVPIALQHQESQTTRTFFENASQLHEYFLHNSELFYDKWRPFGAVLSTECADLPKKFELSVGEEVLFHRDGRGPDFLAGGWSLPEDWGVWTNGSVAKLRFHLTPRPAGKVVLRIQLNAFISAASSVREVDVSIANKLIDRWRFDV